MIKRFPLFLSLFLIAALLIFALFFYSGSAAVVISRTTGVKVNPAAALRRITDTSSWRKWWPGEVNAADGSYTFENVRFGPPGFYYNLVGLPTVEAGLKTMSRILIIPMGADSVLFNWTDSIPASRSFLAKWKDRGIAAARGVQIGRLLDALKLYLNDPVNVYGFRAYNEISRDSTLISVEFQSPDSPGTTVIYQKLDELKTYIASKHANVVNYPMIHVEGRPGAYVTMLAYPVNKALPDSGPFRFKRFLPWKMISAEVHGGEPTVRTGYRQFYQYIQDHGISVMANGFALLVTDRRQEPDSSKWVTRFSAPIP